MIYNFIHLSWSEYFETMAFLLAAYWLLIGTLFYKKELRKLVQGGGIVAGKGNPLNVDSPFAVPVQDSHQESELVEQPVQRETKQPTDHEEKLLHTVGRSTDLEMPIQDNRQEGELSDEPGQREIKRPRETEDELLYTVGRFTDEVRAYMRASSRESASRESASREELLEGLHSLLVCKPYSALGETELRTPINKLMAIETEEHCGMHFTAEELDELWLTSKKKDEKGIPVNAHENRIAHLRVKVCNSKGTYCSFSSMIGSTLTAPIQFRQQASNKPIRSF